LTCLTVCFVLVSCGGCTTAELEKAQSTVAQAHQVIDVAAPIMQQQPWYILVMLAADIASSAVAGYLAFKKTQDVASVAASK
jgi:hypothetical protein